MKTSASVATQGRIARETHVIIDCLRSQVQGDTLTYLVRRSHLDAQVIAGPLACFCIKWLEETDSEGWLAAAQTLGLAPASLEFLDNVAGEKIAQAIALFKISPTPRKEQILDDLFDVYLGAIMDIAQEKEVPVTAELDEIDSLLIDKFDVWAKQIFDNFMSV